MKFGLRATWTTDGLAPGLAQFAETLCSPNIVGQLRQVCERWLYSTCLHFVLSATECQESGLHYDYSLYQAEYSHNLLFHHGRQMEQVFEALIDRTRTRLDIKRLKTIFGLKKRPARTQHNQCHPPREEIVIERPAYDLTVFKLHFGPLTAKLYSKGERVLRCEAIVHNVRASNTGSYLVARFEANTTEDLEMVKTFFRDRLHKADPMMLLPF